jgi:hypothetical protein
VTARRTRLERAIAAEQWELVALALVLGALQTLESLPPQALAALVDIAGGDHAR